MKQTKKIKVGIAKNKHDLFKEPVLIRANKTPLAEFYSAVNSMRSYQKLFWGTNETKKDEVQKALDNTIKYEMIVDKMLAQYFLYDKK